MKWVQLDIILAVVPLLAIGYIHRRIAMSGAFMLVLSNLPVTIMHEMAHFTVALLLGAKPTGFSIWPHREGNRWQLGSVSARVNFISAAPMALAPLLWLVAGLFLLLQKDTIAQDSLKILAGVYLGVYLCIAASIPSRQDIKVALSHPMSLLLWVAIIVAADRLIG
ncbi:MAG TPA: hypothetical protein HPP76_01715 [Desulfuromonadales bacterium]|nr:hypothetical protein [Desulfuromonadales bacterium]